MEGSRREVVSNKKVKWGVLSTAGIGVRKVIPGMQAGEWSDIVAIASRDGKKAEDVARKLRIPKAYWSYEDLLLTRRSRPSTIRCLIICMCPGPSKPRKLANTCSAKSPSG